MSKIKWEPVGIYGDDSLYGYSCKQTYVIKYDGVVFVPYFITSAGGILPIDPETLILINNYFTHDGACPTPKKLYSLAEAKKICERYEKCHCMI